MGSECFTWNQTLVEKTEVEVRGVSDPGDKMEIQNLVPDLHSFWCVTEELEGIGGE